MGEASRISNVPLEKVAADGPGSAASRDSMRSSIPFLSPVIPGIATVVAAIALGQARPPRPRGRWADGRRSAVGGGVPAKARRDAAAGQLTGLPARGVHQAGLARLLRDLGLRLCGDGRLAVRRGAGRRGDVAGGHRPRLTALEGDVVRRAGAHRVEPSPGVAGGAIEPRANRRIPEQHPTRHRHDRDGHDHEARAGSSRGRPNDRDQIPASTTERPARARRRTGQSGRRDGGRHELAGIGPGDPALAPRDGGQVEAGQARPPFDPGQVDVRDVDPGQGTDDLVALDLGQVELRQADLLDGEFRHRGCLRRTVCDRSRIPLDPTKEPFTEPPTRRPEVAGTCPERRRSSRTIRR